MSDKRLFLLEYDGINLFYKGEWTGIEFDTLEDGREWLAFLKTLSDEQVEHFVRIWQCVDHKARRRTLERLTKV
jgi:ribulose bisphosphate carboxylase small subunit